MAVFRVEKTKDFTVMSNHHLRNVSLSLKAKGLLSLMLSLPDNWDYTTKGLAHICKDGVDSISSAIKELEKQGYLTRRRLRDYHGRLGDIEYVIHAILGPSGCGKTTLLSLIGGLDSPGSGQIYFDGQDIAKTGLSDHRKNHVAFIFQAYNLIDYLTPAENVSLTSKLPPLPILERLGLTKEEARRNVLKLSGGQQQRVAIARALASEAPVILADEPTGNLDEDTAQDITEILKESAHKMNKCVVVVTHSNELAKQADVVFRLKKGELQVLERVQDGAAQPQFRRNNTPRSERRAK